MGMITLETGRALAEAQAISVGIGEIAGADPALKGDRPLRISAAGLGFTLPKGGASERYLGLIAQEASRHLAEVNAAARAELEAEEPRRR